MGHRGGDQRADHVGKLQRRGVGRGGVFRVGGVYRGDLPLPAAHGAGAGRIGGARPARWRVREAAIDADGVLHEDEARGDFEPGDHGHRVGAQRRAVGVFLQPAALRADDRIGGATALLQLGVVLRAAGGVAAGVGD